MDYRDPITTFVVTQLLAIREGRSAATIRLDHLTLSQAVDTAHFYLCVAVIVPAQIAAATVPPLFPVGGIGLGTLISLPLALGAQVMSLVLSALSDGLANACLARKTDAQTAETRS